GDGASRRKGAVSGAERVIVIELDDLLAGDLLGRPMGEAGIAPAADPPEVGRNVVALVVLEKPEPREHRREDRLGEAEAVEKEGSVRRLPSQEIVELRELLRHCRGE